MEFDRTYHRIASDLEPGKLEEWAAEGITEIEEFLARRADFLASLEGEA